MIGVTGDHARLVWACSCFLPFTTRSCLPSFAQADRDARYNQRLARARMSNKNVRAAQPPPPEPQEPNLINLQENLINVI
eukprot:3725061-Pleurochrysis_carterae.AAC.6